MPCLLNLSLEIQEMIVLKLESVDDVISLGSSCKDLARTVGQERIWRGIFSKTQLVGDLQWVLVDNRWTWKERIREDLVRKITTFLTSLDNREAIFSLLHQTIYKHYPATRLEYFTVSFPPSPQLHLVSDLGLELLARTGREEARHIVHKVKMSGLLSSSLLISLAFLMKERITELEVTYIPIYCKTEDEGRALVSLLEGCSSWRVEELIFSGEVGGQTWKGLGREVARGRLKQVRTPMWVVGRGRREDIRAVWENTEKWFWNYEEEWGEEGWRKIEKWIGVEWVHMDRGGLTCEGLAREVAGGRRLKCVYVNLWMMDAKTEDLQAVWRNTEIGWLYGDFIHKSDGEEEGWRKIVERLEDENKNNEEDSEDDGGEDDEEDGGVFV